MNANLVEVRSNVNLGNTYPEHSMSRMAAFNPERAEEIRGRVRGAALDGQKPEGLAAVLDANMQASKVALKVPQTHRLNGRLHGGPNPTSPRGCKVFGQNNVLPAKAQIQVFHFMAYGG